MNYCIASQVVFEPDTLVFVKNGTEKFALLEELVAVAERGFRFKLSLAKPSVSTKKIEKLVEQWYHKRPGAPHGDYSNGRIVPIDEYLKSLKSRVNRNKNHQIRSRAHSLSKKS